MSEKKPTNLRLVANIQPLEKPPRPLGKHGAGLWRRIVEEFSFPDTPGREMLYAACAALDVAEQCATAIKADGPVIRLKGGGIREHPALRAELAHRSFIVRTLGKLGLDYEPVKVPGRPPSPVGWQGDD
jgi:hypothetical protein